jgi:hypothetical protein
MIRAYVKTQNNNIVILDGNRESFRCRQRNKDRPRNKDTKKSFRFISYREAQQSNSRVHGPYPFYSISKL